MKHQFSILGFINELYSLFNLLIAIEQPMDLRLRPGKQRKNKRAHRFVGRLVYPITYGICGDLNHDPMTITAREIPEPNCQGVLGVGL